MSWFTFRDLFLRCHLRPICAPALSVAGFARDQLSHAITVARFRCLTRSLLSRLLEKRRTRFACQAVPSLMRRKCLNALKTLSSGALQTRSAHGWFLQCGMEAAASGAGQDGARMVGPTRPIAGGRPWPRSFSSTVPGRRRVYKRVAAPFPAGHDCPASPPPSSPRLSTALFACGRAHRRRLGRRAHGAWWPPESGRDRIAFSTHNAHEGPEARN